MRTTIAYTCARLLLLIVALWLLDLAGARGIMLFALAFLVSGLASYVLLSRQRDALSVVVNRRLGRVQRKAAEFRARIEDGAAAEDGPGEDDTAEGDPAEQATPASGRG